ncbi:MAG: GGDEF domain-containing protein [Pseudomonadota bacterium]
MRSADEQGPETGTFDATRRTAEEALELAIAHQTAPDPQTFEVWYTYAEQSNEMLTSCIDAALRSDGGLSDLSLKEIYDELLSPRAMHDDLADISDNLGQELSNVVDLVQGGVTTSGAFAETLKVSIRALSAAPSREDLRSVAGTLFKANQAQLSSSNALQADLKRAQDQVRGMEKELADLRMSAFTDHLTGLANRRRLEEVMQDAIERARHTQQPLAFALADVDRFKTVNDVWGHAVGDNILRGFARVMMRNVKGQDTAARFGGEEFALLLPKTAARGAEFVCNTIRRAFGDIDWVTQRSGEKIGRITVSIGATQLRDDDTAESLIARADELLYAAKKAGRNQVCVSA